MGKQWHYVGSVYTWERGSTSTGIQYRYCRGSWDLSEQKPQVDHRTARVRRGPEQEHSNGTRELQMRNPQPWGKMGADRRKESIPGKKEFILNIGKSLSVRCQSRTSYPFPISLRSFLFQLPGSVTLAGNMERAKEAHIECATTEWLESPRRMLVLQISLLASDLLCLTDFYTIPKSISHTEITSYNVPSISKI